MALQFGSTKIGAMQYNGVTIGEAMYNGQIVYKSAPAIVPFVDDFTSPTPHTRWTLLPGVYSPPGFNGAEGVTTSASTPLLAGDFEITMTATPGPGSVSLDVTDGDGAQIGFGWYGYAFDTWSSNNDDLDHYTELTTVPADGDTITVRNEAGVVTITVSSQSGEVAAPSYLTGPVTLTIYANNLGASITEVSYTPL